MAHIFISYSKQDIDFARYLRRELQDKGFPVWMDETKLVPSQHWWPTIEQNILNCSAFIVIMSPRSRESEWVEREILVAEEKDVHKPIFPVLLEGKPWRRLANIQYADMSRGVDTPLPDELLEGLRSLVPPGSDWSVPPPLPGETLDTGETIPPTKPTPGAKRLRLAALVGGLILIIAALVIATLSQIVNWPAAPDLSKTGVAALSSHTPSMQAAAPTETVDVALIAQTYDAISTAGSKATSLAATQMAVAGQTATAILWTPTPSPTLTRTPNVTASLNAFLTQRVVTQAARVALNQTATATLWTPTPTATLTWTPSLTPTLQLPKIFTGHTDSVLSVAFAPDGKTILTGSNDNTARLWDVQSGQTLHTFTGHTAYVYGVAFAPDGKTILTGSQDKTARLWDVQSGQTLRTFTGHTDIVISVAFAPDGKTILTGSADKTARLWDVQSGQTLRTFTGHTYPVTGVAFAPDGKTILTGSTDKTARLWDVQSGQLLHTFNGHTNSVNGVAFAPDGKTILTGSSDNTARLWDVRSGQLLHTFNGHTGYVYGVAFAPDGKTILTGSQDKTARLWDVQSGQTLHTFTEHTDIVYGVAFAPDGKSILTSSGDKTARLWDATLR